MYFQCPKVSILGTLSESFFFFGDYPKPSPADSDGNSLMQQIFWVTLADF
jgi:hypothetical protein